MATPEDPIIIAAVEGGGTSFVVAIAEIDTTTRNTATAAIPNILHRIRIDSSHEEPQRTLDECAQFLITHKPANGYQALGIATFGPLGVNETKTKEYGHILNTSPKQSWRNVDILTPLKNACRSENTVLPIKVETDVNAPAFAEYLYINNSNNNSHGKNHQSQKISSLAYVTVGTGVGVGLVINDKPVHGRMHPEGGHIPVQPLEGDTFQGYSWNDKSPFNGKNTVESVACSIALTERLQELNNNNEKKDTNNVNRDVLVTLSDDHVIWDHATNALANLCATLLLTLSIEKIVFGGGIMKRQSLITKIQQRTIELLNNYIELPDVQDMSNLISRSTFGDDAGLIGSIVLAQHAYYDHLEKTNKKQQQSNTSSSSSSSMYYSGILQGIMIGCVLGGVCLKLFGQRKR